MLIEKPRQKAANSGGPFLYFGRFWKISPLLDDAPSFRLRRHNPETVAKGSEPSTALPLLGFSKLTIPHVEGGSIVHMS
jgi:hypothetical protein